MRNLWPSIDVIESNLFGSNNETLAYATQPTDSNENSSAEIPSFLLDKIEKRVASRAAHFDLIPKSGQVWRFDGAAQSLSPLCVLLDSLQENNLWQGYIVAPETDYASEQDVLLEPQDEPFDPLAGMVQTWNIIVVDVSQGSRVLALLDALRLDAIREVAQSQFDQAGSAHPGFVAPIKTNSGAIVLTGTRISHQDDPRRRYQELYRRAAQRLNPAYQAEAHQETNVISLPTRHSLWQTVGWSLAASVILAQAVIIANQMRTQPDKTIQEQMNNASEYRGVEPSRTSDAYLDVIFKPDTKEIEISKLLTRIHASIVDGPGEFGQYRIKINSGTELQTIQVINESHLADSVQSSKPK
jgi:hypothetical protein